MLAIRTRFNMVLWVKLAEWNDYSGEFWKEYFMALLIRYTIYIYRIS